MVFNPQPKRGIKKKDPKPLKRTALKKGKKPTGEKEIFQLIAESRPWVCFVTKTQLKVLSATSFMHVLSKSKTKYPKMKLYPDNIVLAQDWVHYCWDHTPHSDLVHPMWKPLFKLEKELKEKYKLL